MISVDNGECYGNHYKLKHYATDISYSKACLKYFRKNIKVSVNGDNNGAVINFKTEQTAAARMAKDNICKDITQMADEDIIKAVRFYAVQCNINNVSYVLPLITPQSIYFPIGNNQL